MYQYSSAYLRSKGLQTLQNQFIRQRFKRIQAQFKLLGYEFTVVCCGIGATNSIYINGLDLNWHMPLPVSNVRDLKMRNCAPKLMDTPNWERLTLMEIMVSKGKERNKILL